MSALELLNDIITTFQKQQVEEIQYDVIMVGGGPAGIAAARKLSQNHIKCCILEARERLGGRVYSDYWEDNISIDYGPQWIHHVPSNGQHLFVNLAKDELNIDLQNAFLQKESVESRRYHRKRLIWDEMTKQEIPSPIYTKITYSAHNALKKQVLNYNFSRNIKHKNYSIYDVFKDYYNKIMIGLPKELQSIQQFIIDNQNCNMEQFDVSLMERCIDKILCIHESADGPMTEESLYHWHDDTLGGYNIYMQGKYGEFMKMIANSLDKNSVDIRYRNIVKYIKYNHEQKYDSFKMEIIAKDSGLDIMRKYKAKHVIICIPIGCLQRRTIEFIPRLKDTFWRSIDNGIGITNCNKLILQFDGQFPIKNEVTTINIISKQDGYKQNKSIAAENQNYGFGHRMGVDYEDRKMYNIWVIFIGQHFWSQEINDDEKKDNDDDDDGDMVRRQNDFILKETVNIFKDMFCGKNMEFPSVKRYHITRWDIDEYSVGCWCFMKKGGNGSIDCDAILNGNDIFDIENEMDDNNVDKRLQFAGEYARGDGIGTVYAAFVAGTITANNILDINQK